MFEYMKAQDEITDACIAIAQYYEGASYHDCMEMTLHERKRIEQMLIKQAQDRKNALNKNKK